MVESRSNSLRAASMKSSLVEAIAALPVVAPHEMPIPLVRRGSAALTERGVEDVNTFLHEQRFIDDDVDIRNVSVRRDMYKPSYHWVDTVSIWLYPDLPAVRVIPEDVIAERNVAPIFAINVGINNPLTPASTIIENIISVPNFSDHANVDPDVPARIRESHEAVVEGFKTLAESDKILSVVEAVHGAIKTGNAVRTESI